MDTDTSGEGDADKSNQFAGNHGVPCAERPYLTIRGLEDCSRRRPRSAGGNRIVRRIQGWIRGTIVWPVADDVLSFVVLHPFMRVRQAGA